MIGSFNFALHYAVLSGKRNELRRNIETVTFTVTLTLLTLITTAGLMKDNVYPNAVALFRKGFYQLISGHTTTGFMTIYAKQFYHEWGDIALFAMLLAMLLGGSACSTAGGFKAMRTGIIFNAFKAEVKRMLLPESQISEQNPPSQRHCIDGFDDQKRFSDCNGLYGYFYLWYACGYVCGFSVWHGRL